VAAVAVVLEVEAVALSDDSRQASKSCKALTMHCCLCRPDNHYVPSTSISSSGSPGWLSFNKMIPYNWPWNEQPPMPIKLASRFALRWIGLWIVDCGLDCGLDWIVDCGLWIGLRWIGLDPWLRACDHRHTLPVFTGV
jgi:hypothetical protein